MTSISAGLAVRPTQKSWAGLTIWPSPIPGAVPPVANLRKPNALNGSPDPSKSITLARPA